MRNDATGLLVVLLAIGSAAPGCGDDSTPTADDGGGVDDTAADADADADTGGDDVSVEDAVGEDAEDAPEADVDPCGPTSCPNDPVNGAIGAPCLDATDCAPGIRCITESTNVYEGEDYIRWSGGYCLIVGGGSAGCDPADPSTCRDGSACFFTETDEYGYDLYACLDLCADASDDGVPWETNCDCRDGYQCRHGFHVCWPGCSHDRECCEIWHDGEGGAADEARQAAEVTLLPASECTNTCDPCTYACVNEGCPGGACDMMSPCEHDSDCPVLGQCLDEFTYDVPGGMCTQVGCELVGRECPPDAGCANDGTPSAPLWRCFRPCTVDTGPGDPGFTCRDAGTAGIPDVGDYACYPWRPEDWFDGTTADGLCLPGNFPGGTTPLSGPCTGSRDCVSPAGLGLCFAMFPPAICTSYCNARSAEAGLCDAATGGTPGSGACLWQTFCAATCSNPGAPPGSATTGCPQDGLACVPVAGIPPTDLAITTGAPSPTGVCWPACNNDEECAVAWGGGSCNVATGVCE
ncbi:MAG: hypothetical protein HY905_14465 [Deltaproteobacteria bacterium]|nr:hypothetical protein [Deltaproteobacteria bacterium]